jgi:hypothetical protein
MRRLLVTAALGSVLLLMIGGSTPAAAKSKTTITVRSGVVTVNGSPVDVPVKLSDADGRPVSGALLRLTIPAEFMGKSRDEIVGEATTDDSGEAILRFAPTQTGGIEATVAYWGGRGYAPSTAAVTFDVTRAMSPAFETGPPGLQAPWARSYLILIPFFSIWITYVLVLSLAVRMRRAGVRTREAETS